MSEIVLTSDQTEDFIRTIGITDQHPVVLNTSPTGSGKTVLVMEFLRRRNIKRAIVVCNNSVQVDHWEAFKERYNAPIVLIISYDTLRGSKTVLTQDGRRMVVNGLLYKDLDDNFYPSEIFMQWVEEGLCLISDECHSIKNDRAKTSAFKALSRYITIRSMTQPYPLNKSWTYFLSMTPFDKPEHCVNFLFTCGIIRGTELYNRESDTPSGIIDLYNYCRYFNLEKTNSVWGLYDVKSNNVNEVAYRLTAEVFLRLISTFCRNSQHDYKSKQSIYYSYSDIPPEAHIMMKKALNMIKAPVKTQQIQGQEQKVSDQLDQQISSQFETISMGQDIEEKNGVIYGTITYHTVKTYYILVPLIYYLLQNVPNVKILVFLDYKESVNIIMHCLSMYNPVKITGDVGCTREKRKEIINKFNEPNLDIRILVFISQIGSDSIELDDRDGRFPRIGLGFPDFYYSRFFQCPGRLYRRFTESNSIFLWCLVNTDEYQEESVFKSTNDKTIVMQETLQNNQIVPPISYQKIINPHLHDFNYLLRIAGTVVPNRTQDETKKTKGIIKIENATFRKRF